MLPHDRELVVRQRTGLLEDLVRHTQLADVMEQAAEREVAQSLGREPELVADLDRSEGDAAGVLFRVRVLLGQGDEQSANVRAQERLLLRDEVGALQVAEQRAGAGGAAPEVERDGEADGRDADDLEAVAEPPAEIGEVEEQSSRERGGEPDESHGHDEVRRAPREPIRAERAPEEQRVEDEAPARA